MRHPFFLSRYSWRLGFAGTLGILALIAAIYLATSTNRSSSSPQITGSNNPAVTGCPGTAANVQWPSSPTVVLQLSNSYTNTTVAAHQTIQIDLPSGYQWTLQPLPNFVHVLQPAGYYDSSAQQCVWRLQVDSQGTGTIEFHRQQICQSGRFCTPIVILVQYALTSN